MSEEVLARDDDGLLYRPELRRSMAGRLPEDRVSEGEALLALREAALALDRFTRLLRNRFDLRDVRMKVLVALHDEAAGVAIDELVAGLGQDAREVVNRLEAAGMLARLDGPQPAARLTDQGTTVVNDLMRRLASDLAMLADGIRPADLAVMRHVCLRLVANNARLPTSGRTG
jgi:hypothetical protein